jgi:hypothetical protein
MTKRLIEAKAPSTVDKYSRGFGMFKTWTARYRQLTALPANSSTVGLYLEYLLENNSPYSKLESAFYSINWAHSMYGFPNPCGSGFVRNLLEAAKRKLAKPIRKKDPITLQMLTELCEKYATENSNLSDLRIAALCGVGFHAFFRFNELGSLRCCDVNFVSAEGERFVALTITQSKTDIYHHGNTVLMAETKDVACPFSILSRYVKGASIGLSSTALLFRSVYFCKSKKKYVLRSTGLSYSRAREIVLAAFTSLGYPVKNIGLHSLRSGGATAAANAGVRDRLFKRHGRWKLDKAKDGYVKDNLHSLLSVSKALHDN